MGLSMLQIGDKLGWHFIINYPEQAGISFVCPLPESRQDLRGDILYVINLETLKFGSRLTGVNLLCLDYLNYADHSPSFIKMTDKINLLFPPHSLKVDEAVALVQHLLQEEDWLVNASVLLYQALASGEGVQHIINVALNIFHNPIQVSDNSFKLLAHGEKHNTDDELWLKIVKNGYFPEEYIQSVIKDKELFKYIYESDDVKILSDNSPHRYLSKKVSINGKSMGFLSIIEYERPFTDADIRLFDILCSVVSCELRSSNYLEQIREQKYEYLLAELLSGYAKKEIIEERLNYVDLKLKKFLSIMVLQYRDDKNSTITGIRYLRKKAAELMPEGKIIIYNHHVVVLLSKSDQNFFSGAFLSKLAVFAEEHDLLAGISRYFAHIKDVKIYFDQARQAICLGKRLDPGKKVFDYPDYCFYHLLELVPQKEHLKAICSSEALAVIDYDRTYQTNYSQTLYTHLAAGLNSKSTAQVLKIHRNTVDYRINKIKDLFNIELRNAETIFLLNISFRILLFLEEFTIDEVI